MFVLLSLDEGGYEFVIEGLVFDNGDNWCRFMV
jgi:hypothetical protein